MNTPLGQNVYGTNSRLMGERMPPLAGIQEFEFVLPALALGEGAYSIDAAISLGNGLEAHRLREGARVTVDGCGRSVGFVHTDARLIVA